MTQPTVSIQDVIDYIDFLNNAKKLSNMYKESFEAYIKDKSLPLELRWKMWLDAPSEMKNQYSDIPDFESLEEDFLYDGMFNRYEMVEMVRLVGMFDDTDDRLESLKEEILEQNLESFVYDW